MLSFPKATSKHLSNDEHYSHCLNGLPCNEGMPGNERTNTENSDLMRYILRLDDHFTMKMLID